MSLRTHTHTHTWMLTHARVFFHSGVASFISSQGESDNMHHQLLDMLSLRESHPQAFSSANTYPWAKWSMSTYTQTRTTHTHTHTHTHTNSTNHIWLYVYPSLKLLSAASFSSAVVHLLWLDTLIRSFQHLSNQDTLKGHLFNPDTLK